MGCKSSRQQIMFFVLAEVCNIVGLFRTISPEVFHVPVKVFDIIADVFNTFAKAFNISVKVFNFLAQVFSISVKVFNIYLKLNFAPQIIYQHILMSVNKSFNKLFIYGLSHICCTKCLHWQKP